jgi:hypothetical protein
MDENYIGLIIFACCVSLTIICCTCEYYDIYNRIFYGNRPLDYDYNQFPPNIIGMTPNDSLTEPIMIN